MGELEVYHIPLVESDHCGLRERGSSSHRRDQRKPKPFRYENMWKIHGEYMDFVNQTWDPGSGNPNMSATSTALLSLQISLKKWDREIFGSVKKQVRDLRAELEVEQSNTLYRGPMNKE